MRLIDADAMLLRVDLIGTNKLENLSVNNQQSI